MYFGQLCVFIQSCQLGTMLRCQCDEFHGPINSVDYSVCCWVCCRDFWRLAQYASQNLVIFILQKLQLSSAVLAVSWSPNSSVDIVAVAAAER